MWNGLGVNKFRPSSHLRRTPLRATSRSTMANITRSAKPGSQWSTNELSAYNITVRRQSVVDFFGHELPSIDHLDPNLLSSIQFNIPAPPPTGTCMQTLRFLKLLIWISGAPHMPDSDSIITDFTCSVLRVTGFELRVDGVVLIRRGLSLAICGDINRKSTPDLSLITYHVTPLILLLVQRDKPGFGSNGPEAPLIASAIAAFQNNNRNRAKMGLPALDAMTIPCITMVGTRPCFYKVPVTQHLSDCVVTGQFPLQQTVVTCCAPPSAPEGMRSVDYRHTALRYYAAFCGVAEVCWAPILTGCPAVV